jgi:hypothetical protein
MLAKGLIRDTGVLAPEQVYPQPFLDLTTIHGAPWGVVDLPIEA